MTAVFLAAALIAVAWFSLRYAWWRPPVDYRHPRILMYHMVSEARPGAKFNKLRVAPRRFDEQIRWLAENGWHFALMADLASGEALPEKTVILTFDDGYEDNLVNADPILARYGARATLYLVEDLRLKFFQHHLAGCLPRTKAWKTCLFLKRLGGVVEGGVHFLRRYFDAKKPLARRQGFNGDVHGRFVEICFEFIADRGAVHAPPIQRAGEPR